jgi:hypothetical protein
VALRPNDHHTHYPRSRCSSTLRRSSSSARHQQPSGIADRVGEPGTAANRTTPREHDARTTAARCVPLASRGKRKPTHTHTHTECLFWPCRRRDTRKVRYRTFLWCRNSHPSEGKSLWSGQGVSHDAVWGQAKAVPLDLLQCAVIVRRRGGLGGL